MDSSLRNNSLNNPLMEEEKKYILKVLPILLKEDAKFRDSLYEILGQVFTKKDEFSELKDIIKDIGTKVGELVEAQKKTVIAIRELTEAQKNSEGRLTRLEQIVGELIVVQKELTEAQKNFEVRLTKLEQIVGELVGAQKKTDIAIRELTEAQKNFEVRLTKLEQTVEELVEAQKKTDIAIRELTEAQKRTEESLKKTRAEVGGLSRSVAYSLENEAYRMLPKILKEDYGIEVIKKFVRKEVNKKEINILGEGRKDGKDVVIVGEVKLRFEKKDIDIFEELDRKALLVRQKDKEIVKILVAHYVTDEFMEVAKEKDVIVIQSFEW